MGEHFKKGYMSSDLWYAAECDKPNLKALPHLPESETCSR